MENNITTIEDLLKSVLTQRMGINPRYSLRSFARDLEVSPSILCEALSGKHNISVRTAERITRKLNFTHDETLQICQRVRMTLVQKRRRNLSEKLNSDVPYEEQLRKII